MTLMHSWARSSSSDLDRALEVGGDGGGGTWLVRHMRRGGLISTLKVFALGVFGVCSGVALSVHIPPELLSLVQRCFRALSPVSELLSVVSESCQPFQRFCQA